MQRPDSTRALIIEKSRGNDTPLYHEVILKTITLRSPGPNDVTVRVNAIAFNHRELWIRKGQYPGISFGSVLGSDAVGTVIASERSSDDLIGKRVFLVPMRGWESAPDAPEAKFGMVGGCTFPNIGVFSEYITVERDQVIIAPDHLDDVHAAAWPLAGVTAWRAVSVNAQVQRGDSILITGIGGGVALIALQLCVAKGASVYVTSGSDEKIQKAMKLGAKAGVNYKKEGWPSALGEMLRKESVELSTIIDSGGGDLLSQIGKYLKQGGKLVCYGMTAQPKITFTMREVLKNQRILGSTMGSHKDLIDGTEFIKRHYIEPVVSHVIEGLEEYEKAFEQMHEGSQFGKIVLKVHHPDDDSKGRL